MNKVLLVKERISSVSQGIHAWFARQLDDQQPKGTIAALDGVRAVACIMVVIYHSLSVTNGHWDILKIPALGALGWFGAKGVTLFFLLSGFLLFLPYAQALLFEKRWPQARMFYLRRILRIVPGYYFALFAILFLAKPYYFGPHNWATDFSFLTFFMTSEQSGQINPVYWTLAVEFQYYMLLPLIALGIYGLTRLVRPAQRLWIVIGSLFAMATWGVATRAWGHALVTRPDAHTYLASHTALKVLVFLIYGLGKSDQGKFFEDFAVGMLLAVGYLVVTNAARGDHYRRVLARLSPWLWWIGIALLTFAAMRNYAATASPVAAYPFWALELAFALGFGACMFAILFNGTGLLKRFFEWTPLRWVGLISFSLYLWHFPLVTALEWGFSASLFQRFSPPLAVGLFAVTEWVLILSVSFTLYIMVEKPAMRLNDRLRHKNMARQKPQELTRRMKTVSPDAVFDPEKTEPRQPVVLAETPQH